MEGNNTPQHRLGDTYEDYEGEPQIKAPLLSNKAYDRLKWVVLVFLPAFGALYFGLAALWGLPKADEVVGTCAILATFLGALIKVGDRTYNNSPNRVQDATLVAAEDADGTMTVVDHGVDEDGVGKADVHVSTNKPPPAMADKGVVVFKVDKVS